MYCTYDSKTVSHRALLSSLAWQGWHCPFGIGIGHSESQPPLPLACTPCSMIWIPMCTREVYSNRYLFRTRRIEVCKWDLSVKCRAKKFKLSSVTHVLSGLMGCASAVLSWWAKRGRENSNMQEIFYTMLYFPSLERAY